MSECNTTRRLILKAGASLVCSAGLGAVPGLVSAASQKKIKDRSLSFYNIHTGESLTTTYFAEGQLQHEAHQSINHLLRDFRNNQIHEIDTRLLDLLYSLKRMSDCKRPIHVLSGYRSPQTNAYLYRTTSGVAKNSLHMKGQAIDVQFPKIPLDRLYLLASSMQWGGVGYYGKSRFMHLDTGPVKQWLG
jgi:uncharacterized protein YcbK (DUF882 family)